MKILKFAAYYEPELTSGWHIANAMEKYFTDRGHEFEIFTPVPTKNVSAALKKKYSKILYEEKYGGKIHIHRFKMFKEGHNPILRTLRYILSVKKQYKLGKKVADADVIFCESLPPTLGKMAGRLAKKLNIPFVYCLQDIFPDSLITTGLLKQPKGLIWKIGRKIEDETYRSADTIIVISEDFKNNLLEKGVSEDKIEVIYNFIDVNSCVHVDRQDNKLFDEFGLDRNKFYITYAGNLGKAQDLDVIMKAAEKLKDHQDMEFILIGSGANEENLRKKAANLPNVRFFPMQPSGRISEVYSFGNASVITCNKGAGKSAMPSKTWSILSAETPVLAYFDKDTEMQKIIEANNIGLFAHAGDTDAFIDCVLKLYREQKEAVAMGKAGRKFVVEHISSEICLSKYLKIIEGKLL